MAVNDLATQEPGHWQPWFWPRLPNKWEWKASVMRLGSLKIQNFSSPSYCCCCHYCYCCHYLPSFIIIIIITLSVHGGWGEWGQWQPCSETCGDGQQERYRRCDSPRTQHGGQMCRGSDTDARTCNHRDCEGKTYSRFMEISQLL